jgi:hypothetical protein
MLVAVVPPPVAVARYLRALVPERPLRITYVGRCPGADDAEIDARREPDAWLAELAIRGIDPMGEPTVFDSVIPPDRRRFFSLPGGVPSPDQLWSGSNARTLVELDSRQPLIELAQRLLSHECVLIDPAPALGCACSGAARNVLPADARSSVIALEPPRAPSAVVDLALGVELALPVPDEAAEPASFGTASSDRSDPGRLPSPAARDQAGPLRALADAPHARADAGGGDTRRRSPATGVRAIRTMIPVARVAGRTLPRAYVGARRRGVQDHADASLPPTTPDRRSPPTGPAGAGSNGKSRAPARGAGGTPKQASTLAAGRSGPDSMDDGPRS